LVTLSGEVFLGSGAIVGGGGGDAPAQGTLLGRGRQRRELSAERARLDAELAALQQRLAILDAELEAGRQEAARLSRAHEDARRAAQAAARQEDGERAALDAAGRQLQWARDQLARLQNDQARSQAEAEKQAVESAEVENKLSAERKALQTQSNRLDQLVIDEFQTQQAHWATRVAVAERAISDARVRLGDPRSERPHRTGRSRPGDR
jgi:chromosome segregation ATPase